MALSKLDVKLLTYKPLTLREEFNKIYLGEIARQEQNIKDIKGETK
jgi:hypothetical protein